MKTHSPQQIPVMRQNDAKKMRREVPIGTSFVCRFTGNDREVATVTTPTREMTIIILIWYISDSLSNKVLFLMSYRRRPVSRHNHLLRA